MPVPYVWLLCGYSHTTARRIGLVRTDVWILIFFLRLSSLFVRYNEKGNKFPSAQLVSVISLIWQHFSKSQVYLQASSVKYGKVLIIPAYRKNQHRNYTRKTVQIVYAATKQTKSTYCNYNSRQLTLFYTLYLIINNDHVYILIHWFYWVCNLNGFCNFSKAEE